MVAHPVLQRALMERDFFRKLLELGRTDDAETALDGILALMVELSGAQRGYIELRRDSDPAAAPPRWWRAHACDDGAVTLIRDRVSRGIVVAALEQGDMVQTSSAFTDPRFDSRASVREHQVEAVLCAPIGTDPPRGVIYLEGQRGGPPFSLEVQRLAEMFAIHSDVVVARSLAAAEQSADPTAELRRRLHTEGLIGRSEPIAEVLRTLALVAPLENTVLIEGESGTGKGLVARLIHANSRRAGSQMVEVNCAALPESLVESELFGAVAGAHSTASRTMDGRVAAAEGGTLLLDEIGELTISAQAKLLQLLQDKIYYPLGSSKPVRADVRVIAATNVNLKDAIAAGRFRADLYYRLAVFPLVMPRLTDRREDIPLLAREFCRLACDRMGAPRMQLGGGAVAAVMTAPWPGHVRQLANALEGAVVRAYGERVSVVQTRHVFPAGHGGEPTEAKDLVTATRRFQRAFIHDTLKSLDWKVAAAAEQLDVARSHLYTQIRAFGLSRDDD